MRFTIQHPKKSLTSWSYGVAMSTILIVVQRPLKYFQRGSSSSPVAMENVAGLAAFPSDECLTCSFLNSFVVASSSVLAELDVSLNVALQHHPLSRLLSGDQQTFVEYPDPYLYANKLDYFQVRLEANGNLRET